MQGKPLGFPLSSLHFAGDSSPRNARTFLIVIYNNVLAHFFQVRGEAFDQFQLHRDVDGQALVRRIDALPYIEMHVRRLVEQQLRQEGSAVLFGEGFGR